jgi:pimeloyl-ACP methyl ester carboxylesterase
LLEDQLAGPTLRLSGGRWTSFAEQGYQARVAARLFSARPDVVALSAGCMVALSAPAGTWHRLVGWSAVVDEGTVQRVRGSRILSWHFSRQHARAFRQARVEMPAIDGVFQLLFREGCTPQPSCPHLFVHAEDDPVAPALAVRRRIAESLITCWGGHLGFGTVLGDDVYSDPIARIATAI